nr:hypothetical protein [Tanacetum cinerariifolium]
MQNYQDAIALCRAYGNSDLFITFTSNPKWIEISKMLDHVPGQKSHDRLEIGTRFFKMKLNELLDDLTKNGYLGTVAQCMTPDEINDIISAELPSPAEDPDGYKVVSEFMLHGPCDKDAKYASCTTEGKCSKHYPQGVFGENVTLHDFVNLSALLEREGINITMFTDWFELNKRDPAARAFTDVSRPFKLWEENWTALSKDILHKMRILYRYLALQLMKEQIRHYCLLEIQKLLNRHGRSFVEFQDLPYNNP